MGVLEICQVCISVNILPGEIHRLVTIGIRASSILPHINLPWLIPVPNGPRPLCGFELILEPLSKPPFCRLINHSELIMSLTQHNISQLKYRLVIVSSDDLDNWIKSRMCLYFNVTRWQKGINFLLERWYYFTFPTVDRKPRLLCKL